MELKEYQTFFHGRYSTLPQYLSLSKILIYFKDFQNYFLIFMTKVSQIMEIKQNQTFSHVEYSNLTMSQNTKINQ